MYTEEENYGKKPFPFRDFLLKLILVIIFVFLLIWLLPKFISPSTENMDEKTQNSQVFSDNLDRMKEAAIGYYTTDRLPQTVGESQTMTLREMINSNLLIPFVDQDGKACDVDDSYVTVTKEENEYLLKVNLKCSEEEDYVLTHLGNYSYCTDTEICEKDNSVTINNNSTETTTTNESSSTSTPKEEETESVAINTGETSTENSGNASGSNNSSSSSSKPSNPSTPNSGLGSGQGSNSITINNPKKTLYEYIKVVKPTFTAWSDWSSWKENKEGLQALDCNDQDASCVKKIILYSRKEQIGTYHGDKVDVPIYATVTYYSVKTRSLISQGSTTIKWSTYNDRTLLNDGYSYTGNTKTK